MIIRHPLRGALGGLLLGFGLAWLLVQLNFVPVGNLTVVVLLLASVLLGLLIALAAPPRGTPPPGTPTRTARA
jgi:membrane protein implicated in regulation of membrane protease activity